MGLFSFFSKKSKQEQPTQEQEKLQESSNVVEEVQKEQVKENIVTDKNTNSVVEEAPQDEVKEENTSDKDSQVEDKTESLDKEEIKDNVSEEKVLEVSNTTDTVSKEEVTKESEQVTEVTDTQENVETESKEKVKLSFFERLKRTRENLAYGLSALVTGKKIDEELYQEIHTDEAFSIGDLTIQAFDISHDAAEPVAYRITDGKKTVGVATDLGVYTEYTIEHLKGLDAVLLEANHDVNMLQVGSYPY